MADNLSTDASGIAASVTVATDEVTYSGDTAAIQVNRIVHVSGAEGSKTVAEIAGTAGSPGTAALTIQGIASGTAVTVSNGGTFATQATLQAGTNAIGKLAANSGVDIGDVDVASVIPGTGTTNLGIAEDAAVADGKVGVLAMAMRQDSPAASSGTDGDAEPLQVADGLLWTRVRDIQTSAGNTVLDSGAEAVKVLLVDSAGQTVSAGSEYTEGDTDASISGVAMLWEDTSDTLRAVSTSKPLPVAVTTLAHGKTFASVTGTKSATATLVAAAGAGLKTKVYSLSLMTSSTSAVTVTFYNGASGSGGTAIATYTLQAISGTVQGITENVSIPSTLFETSANTLLEIAFSAAVSVTYNVRYVQEA